MALLCLNKSPWTYTFTTSQAQTFSVKTELYSLNLNNYKSNILKFHEDISGKIDTTLTAVGKSPSNEDIIIWLFKAYDTSEAALFKEHVRYLKSEYTEGRFTSSKELMLKVEIKYNKLRTENKWKTEAKEEDKQLIVLNTFLEKLKGSNQRKPPPGSTTRTLELKAPMSRPSTEPTKPTIGVMALGMGQRNVVHPQSWYLHQQTPH
jgi:hypothetical protein